MSLFLCLSGISLGQYCWKRFAISGRVEEGVFIEKRFKPSAHYDIGTLKLETLEPWITGVT